MVTKIQSPDKNPEDGRCANRALLALLCPVRCRLAGLKGHYDIGALRSTYTNLEFLIMIIVSLCYDLPQNPILIIKALIILQSRFSMGPQISRLAKVSNLWPSPRPR